MAALPEVPVVLVPLRNKKREVTGYALIDPEDAPVVNALSWYLDTLGYAAHGKPTVRLHRFLMEPEEGYEVDHLTGNRLDNRRANLRVVTHAENMQNHRSRPGQSEFRGVYYDTREGVWYGQVKHKGKRHSTKRFATEAEAAAAIAVLRAEILPFALDAEGVA